MRIRRVVAPLTLVVCAALSACGGGGGDTSGDTTGDTSGDTTTSAGPGATAASGPVTVDLAGKACDLLSIDDVSEAVGAPVEEGTPTSGPAISGGDFSSCVYGSGDPDHPADTATITLYPNTDAADQGRGDDAQPIQGLGDQAYASSFGSVWVYVGDLSFFAQWYAFDGTDAENLPRSQALAQAVLDELH